jgi:ferrous iron transport protein B
MEYILVGQPNSGKSTIFNSVIGYKSVASNFPGVSNEYTSGLMKINDSSVTVVDLPGIYSLQTTDEAEEAALAYLMNAPRESVIINVLDASVLSRSLELTLQLMELRKPMIVALNMMDEAEKKHLNINVEKLSSHLGIPVIPVIARRGKGVFSLFTGAHQIDLDQLVPGVIQGPAGLDKCIHSLTEFLGKKKIPASWDRRLLAIKLLEYNAFVEDYLRKHLKPHSKGRYMVTGILFTNRMLALSSPFLLHPFI